MFSFIKGAPTDYMIHHQGGEVRRRGEGLAFFYYRPTSTIMRVPLASVDVPFVFTETTGDFQTATVQGQLTYRVTEPERLAALLDFSIDRRGSYGSDDPSLVPERLVHATQVLTRTVIQEMRLREAIVSSDGGCGMSARGISHTPNPIATSSATPAPAITLVLPPSAKPPPEPLSPPSASTASAKARQLG